MNILTCISFLVILVSVQAASYQMTAKFANGRPDSIDITFSHMFGKIHKTITWTKDEPTGKYFDYVSFKPTACPDLMYLITKDSNPGNALNELTIYAGENAIYARGNAICVYEPSTQQYPTRDETMMQLKKKRKVNY